MFLDEILCLFLSVSFVGVFDHRGSNIYGLMHVHVEGEWGGAGMREYDMQCAVMNG